MNESDAQFLAYLDEWVSSLKTISAKECFADPKHTAIISVDVTNGFCREGNLASERVATIIEPIVKLFKTAWELGGRDILLMHDCHTEDALEFGAFAEHAICGSAESEAVDEIKNLPFFDQMRLFTKNSIAPDQNTGLDIWIAENPQINTYIAVGDCTDICTYLLAIHLRTHANAYEKKWRVIVPEDCVQTYDLPLETAKQIGTFPHPGDLLHKIFLYHMALNGVEVVKSIQ